LPWLSVMVFLLHVGKLTLA